MVFDNTRWHSFENGFHSFVSQYKQEIRQIISEHILVHTTSAKLKETKRLISQNPDYLLFGITEIIENIDQLEWVVRLIDENKNIDENAASIPKDKIVTCPKNSIYYDTFSSYDFIGKLYYVPDFIQ